MNAFVQFTLKNWQSISQTQQFRLNIKQSAHFVFLFDQKHLASPQWNYVVKLTFDQRAKNLCQRKQLLLGIVIQVSNL